MQFTYRQLEQLTGLAYYTLAQMKSRGIIEADGDGAGTKNDPVTFTDEMVYRLLWVAQLSALNVRADVAVNLWVEAVLQQRTTILVITDNGHEWLDKSVYKKRMSEVFDDHPMMLAVSVPHFMDDAKAKLASFQRVKNFRTKINLHEPIELVH